jgi:hypothetical protein
MDYIAKKEYGAKNIECSSSFGIMCSILRVNALEFQNLLNEYICKFV